MIGVIIGIHEFNDHLKPVSKTYRYKEYKNIIFNFDPKGVSTKSKSVCLKFATIIFNI
jgi:hypothetical protein